MFLYKIALPVCFENADGPFVGLIQDAGDFRVHKLCWSGWNFIFLQNMSLKYRSHFKQVVEFDFNKDR